MATLSGKCRGFVTRAWYAYRVWRLRRATERNVRELRRLLDETSSSIKQASSMTSREEETACMVSQFPGHDGWSVETQSGEVCGWVPRGLFGGDERMPEA